MCGIVGYISPQRYFTPNNLKKMAQSLRHRGPDAEGFYVSEGKSIGLGHRRLSILDLSENGNQPFYSRCGRYVMVFNGEVYNFREIAKELGIETRTSSDTEVIIEAFAILGLGFLDKLNGMFAMAIWDREEKKLHLVRDRIGIKPLLYFWDGKDFAFASEMKALLCLPIYRELNKEAIQDYLFLEYTPSEGSVFKNIHRLRQGCRLEIELGGKPQIKTYYDLLDKAGQQEMSYGLALKSLEERLTDSIRYRQISDVPIGAFLSGGTDSSLICSIFQSLNINPIKTFTIGFDVDAYDESGYASRVARHIKSDHHEVRIGAKEALGWVKNITKYYDEPFAVPSVIPSMLVCSNAKGKATVALSGDGGDELFMGYGYYRWDQRVRKISMFGGAVARKLLANLLALSPNPIHQRGARVLDYARFKSLWLHIWSQEQYMFTEKEVTELFATDYQHKSTLKEWEKINDLPLRPFEKISLFDLKNYLSTNLLHKMDIASMASSLEVRVPLLDHNLVELALSLPQEYKVKDGEQKFLMKKLLEKYLPNHLVYRKKWGFPAPVGQWMLQDLAYLIDKYLNQGVLKRQDFFNPRFIEKLVKEFRAGKAYHFKRVWALVVFQMWFETYMDASVFEH